MEVDSNEPSPSVTIYKAFCYYLNYYSFLKNAFQIIEQKTHVLAKKKFAASSYPQPKRPMIQNFFM